MHHQNANNRVYKFSLSKYISSYMYLHTYRTKHILVTLKGNYSFILKYKQQEPILLL